MPKMEKEFETAIGEMVRETEKDIRNTVPETREENLPGEAEKLQEEVKEMFGEMTREMEWDLDMRTMLMALKPRTYM